jgi:hypothetical protein
VAISAPAARGGTINDPDLLGAIIQVVRLGFVVLLIALALYASDIIR